MGGDGKEDFGIENQRSITSASPTAAFAQVAFRHDCLTVSFFR